MCASWMLHHTIVASTLCVLLKLRWRFGFGVCRLSSILHGCKMLQECFLKQHLHGQSMVFKHKMSDFLLHERLYTIVVSWCLGDFTQTWLTYFDLMRLNPKPIALRYQLTEDDLHKAAVSVKCSRNHFTHVTSTYVIWAVGQDVRGRSAVYIICLHIWYMCYLYSSNHHI